MTPMKGTERPAASPTSVKMSRRTVPTARAMMSAAASNDVATLTVAERGPLSTITFTASPIAELGPSAIAVATVNAAGNQMPKKADGPAVHKDVSELAHELNARQTPPAASDQAPHA